MEASTQFSKIIARQLLPYLYHHDPDMDSVRQADVGEGD